MPPMSENIPSVPNHDKLTPAMSSRSGTKTSRIRGMPIASGKAIVGRNLMRRRSGERSKSTDPMVDVAAASSLGRERDASGAAELREGAAGEGAVGEGSRIPRMRW